MASKKFTLRYNPFLHGKLPLNFCKVYLTENSELVQIREWANKNSINGQFSSIFIEQSRLYCLFYIKNNQEQIVFKLKWCN